MKFLENYETIEQTCASLGMTVPENPEERARFRELWSNREKSWANYALHLEFGLECNNKWCGMCGFHSREEIAAERETINQI